ncbi:MAG: ATP-binding protein [Pseudodonghicola sp.]|nr:ATP-binding protein [Pseudodonghicola sp.]
MKTTNIFYGLAACVALALFYFWLESSRYKSFVDTERREAKLFAEDLSENLEHALFDFELRARGLTTAIELSGDIGQDRFSHLAERFKELDSSIVNLAVVDHGIIKLVHPFEQNRALIGYNLRNDEKQWPAVARTYQTGQVTMQGPIQLLQDKRGMLIRTPVMAYGASASHFGITKIVTVAIDADAIFQEVLGPSPKPNERASGYQVALYQVALTSTQAGGVIVGNSAVFEHDPLIVNFSVPGTELKLAVVPNAGWTSGYRIAWLTDLGLLFIVLTALYVTYVLRRQRAEHNKVQLQLNTAIKTLPDGFVLYDSEDRLVVCNEKYKEIYEKSADALVPGTRHEDLLRAGLKVEQYAEAIGREDEWLAQRLASHKAANSTIEQQLSDGRWLRIFERETPDGGRVGVWVDITESKRHRDELEASNASLRHALAQRDIAEQRFSNVAMLSKDWVWEADKDLRFTFFSNSIQKKTAEYLVGKTRREAYEGFPDVLENADFKRLEEKERAREPFRDVIYQAIGATRDDKWIRTSGDPIFDKNGEFSGYRGVSADISDVYNALREAEAANAAKTEFLNVMSHELRTPLTVVLGFNALLAKPEILPSVRALDAGLKDGSMTAENVGPQVDLVKQEIAKYAKKMETAGKHLLNLINDILDLARIDAGKLQIDLDEVALDPVIASVADQLSETARQKSLELRVEAGGDVVVADELRLRQILINLVGNALKFTERGHVSIRTEPQGDNVAIHVEDSGRGIPREKWDSIFGKFDQVDPSSTREKGGTGLGLSITRQLIELQGGTVSVESEVGVGSTFTFTLPAATSDAANRLSS